MIWICIQTVGNLFSVIDLLKRDTKTLDKAGRQSLRTSREMPSGPFDLVVNCLKAQFKLSVVMLVNLKGGRFEATGGLFCSRETLEF